MGSIVKAFLQMFARNVRAMFFVIFLPAAIFVLLGFLGVDRILQFDLDISYQDYLLPGIIGFALLNTGTYTMAYSLIDFRRTQVLKRISVTPVKVEKFLWEVSFARFLIALVQTGILLAVGWILFDPRFGSELIYLPIIVLVGNTMFLSFGFLVAAIARDYEEAAPFTAIIGLPLTFLGDVFAPLENFPRILQVIAEFLPLKPLASLLRWSTLGVQPVNIMQDIVIVLIWLVILFFVSRVFFAKYAFK